MAQRPRKGWGSDGLGASLWPGRSRVRMGNSDWPGLGHTLSPCPLRWALGLLPEEKGENTVGTQNPIT